MTDKRQILLARYAKKGGLRARIDAKCIECIYDPLGGGGNWRQQVEACTAPDCPLYPVRPISSGSQDR